MSWIYNNEELIEIPKGMEGFVYLITNLNNGRKYIGKKNFWTRQKDKKTGRRKKKESDWKTYFGSCDELKKDLKILGEESFKKEILYICKHKKSMSFYETMEQFKRDVLFNSEYYNTNIEGKYYESESVRIYGEII